MVALPNRVSGETRGLACMIASPEVLAELLETQRQIQRDQRACVAWSLCACACAFAVFLVAVFS